MMQKPADIPGTTAESLTIHPTCANLSVCGTCPENLGKSPVMNLDRILPNVYVGSCPLDADDVDRLKWQLGVTAVLNVQTDEDMAYWNIDWSFMEELYRQQEIRCRRVPVQDFSPENLRALLPDCVEALRTLLDEGHTVYVHCSAGMNRSPSTVIAYLHWIE